MRVVFYTQGCRTNIADTGWLTSLAKRREFSVAEDIVEADAAIINTCTVTHGADRDCRQLVRRIQRTNPHARICLVGCFSQTQPAEAARLGVDYVGGTGAKERVLDFLSQRGERQPSAFLDHETFEREGFLLPSQLPQTEDHTRLFLKIQDGCNHRCTYCIIHEARGASRSMTIDEVVHLSNRAASQGSEEIVLTGIDLGIFGGGVLKPGGLLDLLRALESQSHVKRIRLSSLSPRELPDELLGYVARSSRICPSFHISLQHGSASVLKKMGRPYAPELFRHVTQKIRELMPRASIAFDVIVGFPGETDADFDNVYTLLSETPWSRGHFFPYSPRSGTPSSTMPEQVPAAVKSRRMEKLLALSDQRFAEELDRERGREVSVLVERHHDDQCHAYGYSREFFPVVLEKSVAQPGTVVHALVTHRQTARDATYLVATPVQAR
jgi:threonylcarbamoyladenosine tRNA methylthiotransferase MtaB